MDELPKAETESVPQSVVDPDTNVQETEDSQKNSDSTEVASPPEDPDQNHEPEPNALAKASPTAEGDQKPKDPPTETLGANDEGDSQQDPTIASRDAIDTEGDAQTASEPETAPAEATGETGEVPNTSDEVAKAESEPETAPAEATGETGEVPNTSDEVTKAESELETAPAEATGEAGEVPNTSDEVTKAESEPETAPAETTGEAGEVPNTSDEVTKAESELETAPAEATGETGEVPNTSDEITKAESEPETAPSETTNETVEAPDTSDEVTKAESELETAPAETTGEAGDTSIAPTANDVASTEGVTRTVHDDTKKTVNDVTLGATALVDGNNEPTTTAIDSATARDEPKALSDNSANVEDETKVPDDIPATTNVGAPSTSTNTSPETAPSSVNAEDGTKASLAGSQNGIASTTAVFQDSADINNEARTGKDNAVKEAEDEQIVSAGKHEIDPVSNQEDLLASPLNNKDNQTSRKSVSFETNEYTVLTPVNNEEDLLQSSNNQISDKSIDQLVNSGITTVSPNDRTNVKSASDDEILHTNETSKTLNRDVEIGTAEEIETLLGHRKPKPMPNQSNDIVDKIMSLSENFAVVAAIVGILIFLPIAQVVIGSLYKNSCPLNNLIPTYLLVSGILGICFFISIVCMFSIRKKVGKVQDICSFFQYILSIIYLGWFFVGCVWVFGASKFIQFTNPLDKYYYCNATVFYGAFITLIITSVLVVIFLCGSCCIRAARIDPDEEV